MKRRIFLKQSAAAGALAFTLPILPAEWKEDALGVVVHSYGNRWNSKVPSTSYPAFTTALDLLEHCQQIGAGGIQVIVKDWSADFAKSVRNRREQLGMYLEGSISMPKTAADLPAFERDVQRAKEAGARVLRTVCSGGRRYEILHSAAEFATMRRQALSSLQLAEPVLRRQGIRLAVENHKDWRSGEMVDLLKALDSEWIGATLDFGNNLALLEDPMTVVRNLAPYIISTHVKDMAMEPYADGFLLSEVPLGQGVLDLPAMYAICRKANPAVTFNLEMITRDPLEIPCLKPGYWATFEQVPGVELAHLLKMTQTQKVALPRVAQLSPEERLAVEEKNILACLHYSQSQPGLK